MDLRTGRMYRTVEEAREAGVPESDIAHVVWPDERKPTTLHVPRVKFSRRPFGSFKDIKQAEPA